MSTVTAAAGVSLVTPTSKPTYFTAWWGMVTLIATESMVFVILLGSYVFLRASARHWPFGGIKPPEWACLCRSASCCGQQHPHFLRRVVHPQRLAARAMGRAADERANGRPLLGLHPQRLHDLTFGGSSCSPRCFLCSTRHGGRLW